MHHHSEIENILKKHVEDTILEIEDIPQSGSNRQYFRVLTENKTFIVAYGDDIKENQTFQYFTNTFYNLKINVPQIIAIIDNNHYILEDLGNTSLLAILEEKRDGNNFPAETINILKESIIQLIKIQVQGGKKIDFSKCFVRHLFDKQVFQWDLNYFKYYFLKINNINFNENSLENDFQTFIEKLENIPNNFFMYRDFQSRNIMIKNNTPYFIDYQGGMQGPLQYDLASFLHQARANLPNHLIHSLKEFYYTEISKEFFYEKQEFFEHYDLLHFLRTLQTLGAYGYRGLIQKKEHFIKSIPMAVKNIKKLKTKIGQIIELPELFMSIDQLQ